MGHEIAARSGIGEAAEVLDTEVGLAADASEVQAGSSSQGLCAS